MEQLMNIIVNNGLGVASFAAFIFFIFKYMSKMEVTMEEISKTLTLIQNNLNTLQDRVNNIENIVIKKED